ncbi:hypothetical protein QZH41_001772 [Actinostola sp. cb2023]|nr:hypothetical protein QZH41_001772 [Actinostola sp. cb2023]
MIYHGDIDGKDLFFRPEPRQRSKTSRVWNVRETKSALGPDICSNILFIHTLLGCDTTSRIHGLGKATGLKKFKASAYFKDQARLFSGDANAVSKEDVIAAGERALVCLYSGEKDESLNTLRYSRFCQKVSTGNAVLQPENLPPTSAAASYHSQRVFLQVQQWKGIDLPPLEWGWQLKNGKFIPERTSLPPAHASILEMIRCGCKAKQIQWKKAEEYGEEKFVVMMGGLHIEMASLKIAGHWLNNSGWVSALVQANVTTSGRADAILKGAHVTRARYAHQYALRESARKVNIWDAAPPLIDISSKKMCKFENYMTAALPQLSGPMEKRAIRKRLAESLRYRRNQLKNTKFWKRAKKLNKYSSEASNRQAVLELLAIKTNTTVDVIEQNLKVRITLPIPLIYMCTYMYTYFISKTLFI